MSYTFSRRNFMKYTALAAVAVAMSGSLTACSNPNQPSGVYNGSKVELSFGGSSSFLGIGGTPDKHTLTTDVTINGTKYETKYENGTLTCAFEHYPISEGTSDTANNYQLCIVPAEGSEQYIIANNSDFGFTTKNGASGLPVNKTALNAVEITGLNKVTGLSSAKVYIRYFPRHNALGTENDAYSDVYATWEITSLFAADTTGSDD